MSAITFGLGSKTRPDQSKSGLATLKRKQNLFDEEDGADTNFAPHTGDVTAVDDLNGSALPSSKSLKPKIGAAKNGQPSQQYSDLSAFHAARKHTEEASTVDSTVYEYDTVYDSFHAPKKRRAGDSTETGPKYMTNLLKSAEVRKRDQLRAKERLLQKDRDAEGDEFADKEKFVTDAYKAQQEEIRRLEEEEAIKEAAEEEKRQKGGGMTGFYKDLLKKDEQRSTEISKAVAEAASVPKAEVSVEEEGEEKSAAQIAEDLNARGANVAVNDEGEVVDKRQLLAAGLNVAPKPKPGIAQSSRAGTQAARGSEYSGRAAASSAREAQRERQTRMMAEQLEKMTEQQAQVEAEEQKALEEKAKSQKTRVEISSAKERYLARKREQEAQKASNPGA